MDAGPARRRDGQADCARESVARDGAAALSRRRSASRCVRKMWCIPQVDADYVARMEDVLDLYAEAPDPQRPVVCFDESPIQLIGEVRRRPARARAGRALRLRVPAQRNRQSVRVPRRQPSLAQGESHRASGTAMDSAVCMRELADLHYPKAERIRVVLDNLSTHSAGAFYQAFPAEEANWPLLRRIEFHYVPKHASWLNIGRDRDRRPRRPMPGPSHRKLSAPHRRSRRLGEPAQCRPRPHRLELHNRKGPHQNGASLSEAHKPKTAAKSENLCAEELAALTRCAWRPVYDLLNRVFRRWNGRPPSDMRSERLLPAPHEKIGHVFARQFPARRGHRGPNCRSPALSSNSAVG